MRDFVKTRKVSENRCQHKKHKKYERKITRINTHCSHCSAHTWMRGEFISVWPLRCRLCRLHMQTPKPTNRPFCRYGGHIDFYCFERHYGMLRGQINMYLPPEHPIIAIWNNRNQNGRRICKKVYWRTQRIGNGKPPQRAAEQGARRHQTEFSNLKKVSEQIWLSYFWNVFH